MSENQRTKIGTMVELFAGVGGFRLGLDKYFETVFFNQYEPSAKKQYAHSCYVNHFGELSPYSNTDIAELVEKHLNAVPKDFELLVGGFPCQDYSVAKPKGSAKGLQGKKGVLWWEILAIITKRRPRYVFLENVDRLLKSPSNQKGRDFAIMLRTLGSLGYLVEWRVVNAADYGFPQRRIRVFILAKRKVFFKDLPNRSASVKFLENEGLLAKTFPAKSLGEVRSIKLSGTPDVISENFRSEEKSPFMNTGYYLDGRVYTAKAEFLKATKQKTLESVLIKNPAKVPTEFWIPESEEDRWRAAKAGTKKVIEVKDTDFKFTFSEGKMSFPDKKDRPSRTIVTGEGGSSPSRFKHVVEHKGRLRRLTPEELEKLNGFPVGWTKFGVDKVIMSNVTRAFFMGNALVVGLVKKVAKTLASDLASDLATNSSAKERKKPNK